MIGVRHLVALGLVAAKAQLRGALEDGGRAFVAVEARRRGVLSGELPAGVTEARVVPSGLHVAVCAGRRLLSDVKRVRDLLEIT